MSLINQMLQDIEQRKTVVPPITDFTAQSPLIKQVHAVKFVRTSRLVPSLLLLTLCGAVAYISIPRPSSAAMASKLVADQPAEAVQQKNSTHTLAVQTHSVPVSFSPHLDKDLDLSSRSAQTLNMNADSSLPLTPPQVILPALPLPTSDVGQVVVAQSEVKPKQVVALNTPTVPVNPQSITEVANSDKRISVTKRMSAEQQANHEYQQAVNYLQQGRVAESLDLLKRALHTLPTHDDARLTLIGLLVENQHHEEAMEVLRTGLNLAPYHTAYAQTLARLQLEVSQPQEALETLKKYDAYAERDATYQSLMAVVLQKLQMHTEAITRFESAIKLGETSAARFVGLAVSLQAEGRSQEAAAAYQRALGGNLSPELALFVDQRLKQLRN